MGVLVPLTSPELDPSTGRVPDDVMTDAVRGPLGEALELASTPGWSWALDPALLSSSEDPLESTSAEDLVNDPDAPDRALEVGAASPSDATLAWRERLLAAAPGHSVAALPYADADLELEPSLADLSFDIGSRALATAGLTPSTSLVLPEPGTLSGGLLGELAQESLVLDARTQTPAAGSATVSAPTRVPRDGAALPSPADAPADALRALVTDPVLQDALTETSDAKRSARLAAETAALTRERPYDARSVLLVLPRAWSEGFDAPTLRDSLSAPWLSTARLDDLLVAEPDQVPRAALALAPGGVDPGVEEASRALDALRDFSPALSKPETLAAGELRTASLMTRSKNDRATSAEALTALLSAVPAAVSVPAGSSVNLAAERATLPVAVANSLDQQVSVVLSARTASPRLRASGGGAVVVDPLRSAFGQVELRSLARGDSTLVLALSPPGGDPSSTTEVLVRGRTEWGWVLNGVIVMAGLLFAAGLLKAVLRGKRRRDAAAVQGQASPGDTSV
jgi:hypothetical protein